MHISIKATSEEAALSDVMSSCFGSQAVIIRAEADVRPYGFASLPFGKFAIIDRFYAEKQRLYNFILL
jgi:hypothetical protein